jgi:hypothetical protein
MVLEVTEQASNLVGEIGNVLWEVVGGPETAYRGVPAMSPKKSSGATNIRT